MKLIKLDLENKGANKIVSLVIRINEAYKSTAIQNNVRISSICCSKNNFESTAIHNNVRFQAFAVLKTISKYGKNVLKASSQLILVQKNLYKADSSLATVSLI